MKVLTFAIMLALWGLAAIGQEKPNKLLGTGSPYLEQHAYNPVDWYPWGEAALNKALAEDKMIFVSVGYATCYWCHVMRRESFENNEIAAFLNENFVAIKIDRERRPDLDEQFLLATRMLTGSAGWPNSLFLTPDAKPFYGGTYFPPRVFLTLLKNIVKMRAETPELVKSEGARVSRYLDEYFSLAGETADLTPATFRSIAGELMAEMDEFNGGLGVAPKFPSETVFLFLLDQARRDGDPDLMEAVFAALDGMLKGGIHDQVGGGFHRYAVDPEWHVPHFEKMLYNQALIGRLLLRAWQASGEIRYRRAAERTFDYVLREMRDPKGGFWSAQDAESLNDLGEEEEGWFYTWTPEDLVPLSRGRGLVEAIFNIEQDGEFEGRNVLNLSEMPGEIAPSLNTDEAGFYAMLDPVLDEMRRLRETRPRPLTDRKIVVAWNGVMIESLAEAGWILQRPDYRVAASEAADYILENMRSGDGIYRVSYEGVPTVPAQLADYAALGLGLVALSDTAGDPARRLARLDQAIEMAEAIRSRFGDAASGYAQTAGGGGRRVVPVEDTEIGSGNGLALALFTRLSARSEAFAIRQETRKLAAALSGAVIRNPAERAALVMAMQESLAGETGYLRAAAAGKVMVELRRDPGGGGLRLRLRVAEGWHVNAHQPLEDYFIATELRVDGKPVSPGAYPEAKVKSLRFSDAPLAPYEGEVIIKGGEVGGARRATLVIQACSDEICLQPEELNFTLW